MGQTWTDQPRQALVKMVSPTLYRPLLSSYPLITICPPGDDDPSTGVEEFWLTAFKNCEIFTDIIKVMVFEVFG